MELQEIWKKLEEEKLEVAKPLRWIAWPPKSKHPVQKLKTNYLISTGFALLFLIGFIVLFFLFQEFIVKAALALVIIAYVFFLILNYSMYTKIKAELPIDQSLKIILQHTHDFITDNIRFQEREIGRAHV